MVKTRREQLRDILREEFERIYETEPKRLDDEASLRDVGAYNDQLVGSGLALEWVDSTARRASVRLNLPHVERDKEGYTIGDILNFLEYA
mgnify:CR=1 FL=1